MDRRRISGKLFAAAAVGSAASAAPAQTVDPDAIRCGAEFLAASAVYAGLSETIADPRLDEYSGLLLELSVGINELIAEETACAVDRDTDVRGPIVERMTTRLQEIEALNDAGAEEIEIMQHVRSEIEACVSRFDLPRLLELAAMTPGPDAPSTQCGWNE